MPNIFFSLQVGIILLLLSIALQLTSLFHLGTAAIYLFMVLSVVAIGYCLSKRADVIRRQYRHCDELAKQEKEKKMTR